MILMAFQRWAARFCPMSSTRENRLNFREEIYKNARNVIFSVNSYSNAEFFQNWNNIFNKFQHFSVFTDFSCKKWHEEKIFRLTREKLKLSRFFDGKKFILCVFLKKVLRWRSGDFLRSETSDKNVPLTYGTTKFSLFLWYAARLWVFIRFG